MAPTAGQRYFAEFLGTFSLLLFGGGAAVFSSTLFGGVGFASDPNARVVLVSLAFGAAVAGLIYAFGEISGGHFNPAVTVSMLFAGRMSRRDVLPYLVAQIVGGLVGMLVVLGIASGGPGSAYAIVKSNALASQCFAWSAVSSPPGCGYSIGAVFLIELALTFLFVLVIQTVTRPENSAKNLAPIVIGLTLVVANMVAIPVDGASFNPVRSFSPALLAAIWPGSTWAIEESWLFWIAPILGGILAGYVERVFRQPTPSTS